MPKGLDSSRETENPKVPRTHGDDSMNARAQTIVLLVPGVIASVALVFFGFVLSGYPGYGTWPWLFVAIVLGLVWWDIGYHRRLVRARSASGQTRAPRRG